MNCPETSFTIHQFVPHNNPEERRSHLHRGGNRKSRKYCLRPSSDIFVQHNFLLKFTFSNITRRRHCITTSLVTANTKVSHWTRSRNDFNQIPSLQITKLTPTSTVLPEKLTDPQIFKKFPTFYGARKFITAFTTVSILSKIDSVHARPPHFSQIHFNIIIPSTPPSFKWSPFVRFTH